MKYRVSLSHTGAIRVTHLKKNLCDQPRIEVLPNGDLQIGCCLVTRAAFTTLSNLSKNGEGLVQSGYGDVIGDYGLAAGMDPTL